jgi:drug/metabolite transporter (DMT)-like permease
VLAVILGFATSLVYGTADFFGAIASRRLKPTLVTGISAWAGLLFLSSMLVSGLFHATFSPAAILWGIIGGIFSAFGLSMFYRALAIGPISILSPLSALVAGLVPAIAGAFLGERFGWLSYVAIALVLVAVFLVGFVPGQDVRLPSVQGVLFGIGAGIGIGVVLICLHNAPTSSGIATVILVRLINGLVLGGYVIFQLVTRRVAASTFKGLGPKLWLTMLATGVFDSGANLLFVLAVRQGSLTVVSVLTALYPLGTILLARFVLKEKLALSQSIGIALALGATALLAF